MGEPGNTPPNPRPGQGDHTTSLAILSSILLASGNVTNRRRPSSFGRAYACCYLDNEFRSVSGFGNGRGTWTDHAHRNTFPLVGRFRCADDRWLMLTMPAEGYWEPCEALDQPEWITDSRFADTETRTEHGPELMILCDEILRQPSPIPGQNDSTQEWYGDLYKPR